MQQRAATDPPFSYVLGRSLIHGEYEMPRSSLFNTDSQGWTTLFHAAEIGDMDAVRAIVVKLAGTGVSCERLALINLKANNGDTAIDVARKAGNEEIHEFLLSEKQRMEFFE
jgi:ankyrin repeat protein